jgi:hypothetical protein
MRGDGERALIAARCWYAVLVALVTAAFVVQLVLLFRGGTDVNTASSQAGVRLGARLVRLFSYFTIQSNVIVWLSGISLLAWPDRDGRGWRILRLDGLLGIFITGLVFDLVLAKDVHPTGAAWWANAGFHYFAPWWTLIGWVLFGPRPRISWGTVTVALLGWPLAWIGYTFAHGAATGWYPYPFLDVAKIGYAHAIRNTAAVFVLAIVLALVFKALDRVRSALTREQRPVVELR